MQTEDSFTFSKSEKKIHILVTISNYHKIVGLSKRQSKLTFLLGIL